MKVGDIAYMQEFGLVKITELEYEEEPITEKVKTGWFSFERKETGEVKKSLRRVWWCAIGDEWRQIHKTSTLSAYYEWEAMIDRANLILKQTTILNNK